jgi:hypothetical protein
MGIAVSSGAVLRSLNREPGTLRKARASYGILRHVAFDPETTPFHRTLGKYVKYDEVDGINYIRETIDWVVLKVSLLERQ